jgi:beta-aspartyl-peptidase (threonine type)
MVVTINHLRLLLLACISALISLSFTYGFYLLTKDLLDMSNDSLTRKPSLRKEVSDTKDFRIVIHGGAGQIPKEVEPRPYYDALKRIIIETAEFAAKLSVTALDVVEFAVILLENEELFNAGRGAVFSADETHELEASIMDGRTLKAGAVSMVKTIKNPISLARAVMEQTPHIFLADQHTLEILADKIGLQRVDNEYFSTEKRRDQWHRAKKRKQISLDHDLEKPDPNRKPLSFESSVVDMPGSTGTVGCVCYLGGHVAAATSTGGLTNKMAGRVGDSPLIGAGTYASDKTAAISTTGKGEEFIRHVASYDVSARMDIGKLSLKEAAKETIHKVMPALSGGLIGVNTKGEYVMEFNTPGMMRATCDSNGQCLMGLWEENIHFNILDILSKRATDKYNNNIEAVVEESLAEETVVVN